jgi:hypothetical protein
MGKGGGGGRVSGGGRDDGRRWRDGEHPLIPIPNTSKHDFEFGAPYDFNHKF